MSQYLKNILQADSADDLWLVFSSVVKDMGFPYVFYAARHFADMPRMWQSEELEWRSTYPDFFLADLRQADLLNAAPWSSWSREHAGAQPIGWFDTMPASPHMTAKAHRMIAVWQRHDLWHGQVISLLGTSIRVTGTVVMTGGPNTDQAYCDERWEKLGDEIISLSQVMHLRLSALPRSKRMRVLTPRQREVIEWAAYGKTACEIGGILGVTPTTIEKHLRLAREQLGVGNTAQAILKAHVKNEIFI